MNAHHNPILGDKSMSSCLLQRRKRPRQHTFTPDQGRYSTSQPEQERSFQLMWRTVVYIGWILLALANRAYALEPELWIEDLLQYESGLRELHIDPFIEISEEEFSRTLDELDSTLSGKSDSEVILELMALTRRIGDGHTAIRVNSSFRFPLELYFINGSLRVVAVDQEHDEMLGSSIVSIDGHPIDDVADALRPFLQHVDNIQSEEIRLSESLANAELLFALDLLSEEGTATFAYSTRDGQASTTLEAVQNVDGESLVRFDTQEPTVRRISGPEWEQLWFGLLGDSDAIYIRFSGYPTFAEMESFGEELLNYINNNRSSKLVVDFRGNGGGDFFVGLTLAYYLNLADSIDWKSGTFLLTDKYTFSAAVSNAAQFRQILNAKIIGEPTGGNPVGYQDMGTFRLRNSGVVVTYSKRFFRFQEEVTQGIQPDITVEYDWNAYINGVDNILQFVVDTIGDTGRVN